MAHTIHVLLLIASLLTCPYRCAGVGYVSAEPSSSCSCCEHQREAALPRAVGFIPLQPEEGPSAPSNDCGCDCLCRGTIRTDASAVHDALASCARLWIANPLPRTVSLAAGELTERPEDGRPRVGFAAGRPLRLMLESLQI